MERLAASLTVFDSFDYAVVALNLIMFAFAPTIVSWVRPTKDDAAIAARAYTLRAANVILLVLYISYSSCLFGFNDGSTLLQLQFDNTIILDDENHHQKDNGKEPSSLF